MTGTRRARGRPRAPRRRQGRLLVAHHRCRRASTRTGSAPSSTRWPRRAPVAPRSSLVSSGAIAAGLAPLGLPAAAPRPGHPAGGRLGRPGPAGAPLRRGARPARHHRGPGAAHRRRRDPAQPPPERLPHLRQAARARRAARWSTRTTPSRPPRSASATTTGWPRSSPTSSTPTCCCCSATSTASTTDRRRAEGARLVAEVRGESDLDGIRIGRPGAAGVGTGGMQTKVEAARIATGAGIPVVLAAAADAGAGARRRARRHAVPPDRPAPVHPAALARARDRGQGPPRARRRGGPRRRRAPRLAAAGRDHRGHAASSRPGTRSTSSTRPAPRWPAGWSTTTPTELPAMIGRSTRELARELGRVVRARGRAPRRPRDPAPLDRTDPAHGPRS